MRITGEAKPGYTSGDAIKEMERLAGRMPRGFGYEWTGQSLQEKLAGSQAPFLLGLSVLVVFLLLAAQFESFIHPLTIMLTVPLGVLGALVYAASPMAMFSFPPIELQTTVPVTCWSLPSMVTVSGCSLIMCYGPSGGLIDSVELVTVAPVCQVLCCQVVPETHVQRSPKPCTSHE